MHTYESWCSMCGKLVYHEKMWMAWHRVSAIY